MTTQVVYGDPDVEVEAVTDVETEVEAPVDAETDADEMPDPLRQGWSWGQGVTGALVASGLVLLLFWADQVHQRLGMALVVAGVIGLVTVEWIRVFRRRRAARTLVG